MSPEVPDPRLTAANGRVAHVSLRGAVAAGRYVEGEVRRIVRPVADLVAEPGGTRVRQLLYGMDFLVLDRHRGHAFGQARHDDYVGWLAEAALGPRPAPASHLVAAPSSHLYAAPDIRASGVTPLSFGSRLTITDSGPRGAGAGFAETDTGQFVPVPHLRTLTAPFDHAAGVAAFFLGTPYLWGGNSRAGIDCSGLVQAALLACGRDCPGDSDLQAALGVAIPADDALQSGDLVFWRGHVALMEDPGTAIHATAHHMAVVREPLDRLSARIAASGGGPVTARRRVDAAAEAWRGRLSDGIHFR